MVKNMSFSLPSVPQNIRWLISWKNVIILCKPFLNLNLRLMYLMYLRRIHLIIFNGSQILGDLHSELKKNA